LNRLAGVDAAIVSDIPGTTRDVLREHLVIDGLPLTVVDTAGLRETEDRIEQEGIRRAWAAVEKAEVLLFLIDDRRGLSDDDRALLERLPQTAQRVILRNKCDLSGLAPERIEADGQVELRLSASTGAGLELLRQELRRCAGLSAEQESQF